MQPYRPQYQPTSYTPYQASYNTPSSTGQRITNPYQNDSTKQPYTPSYQKPASNSYSPQARSGNGVNSFPNMDKIPNYGYTPTQAYNGGPQQSSYSYNTTISAGQTPKNYQYTYQPPQYTPSFSSNPQPLTGTRYNAPIADKNNHLSYSPTNSRSVGQSNQYYDPYLNSQKNLYQNQSNNTTTLTSQNPSNTTTTLASQNPSQTTYTPYSYGNGASSRALYQPSSIQGATSVSDNKSRYQSTSYNQPTHFNPITTDPASRPRADQQNAGLLPTPRTREADNLVVAPERVSLSIDNNMKNYQALRPHQNEYRFKQSNSPVHSRVPTDGPMFDREGSAQLDKPNVNFSEHPQTHVTVSQQPLQIAEDVDESDVAEPLSLKNLEEAIKPQNVSQAETLPQFKHSESKLVSQDHHVSYLHSQSRIMTNEVRPSMNHQMSVQPVLITTSSINYDLPESMRKVSASEVSVLSKLGRDLLSRSVKKRAIEHTFEGILQQHMLSKTRYEDPSFVPNLDNMAADDTYFRSKWAKYIWLRSDDIYGKGNYQLFLDSIEINDIRQGQLGNCYFLSVLSALAEFPHRVMKLFLTSEVNNAGCYGVRICDGGEWKEVIIDDYFPCKPGNPRTGLKPGAAFSRGNGEELWVLILEKAWAKLYGSYARIESGFTRETMRDLTGAPTEYFIPGEHDNNKIWQRIKDGEEKDYVMTAGAGDFEDGMEQLNSCGLISSHAYSLLAAMEVVNEDGEAINLVKLRNPWGRSEWQGRWADDDYHWTEGMKQAVNMEVKDDGIFFMEFKDFVTYFSDVQICRVNDLYVYCSHSTESKKATGKFYKIKCSKAGHYTITANQPNKRHFKSEANYSYSEVQMILARKKNDEESKQLEDYEYLSAFVFPNKEVWVDGDFEPGEYLLYVNIDWQADNTRFVLSSYGPADCSFEEVESNKIDEQLFMKSVYIDHAKKHNFSCFKPLSTNKIRRYLIDRLQNGREGIGYLVYMNEEAVPVQLEVVFAKRQGIELLYDDFNSGRMTLEMGPGEMEIILWKVQFDVTCISIQERMSFQ